MRADSNLALAAPIEAQPRTFGMLGQIARGVADIARAERWYRDVLGLRHLYTFGTYAFFDCGGVRLFLAEGQADAALLYFVVPDICRAHADLEARGIAFVTAPHLVHRHADGTEEWMAFFNDEEGRPLALMTRAPKPAPQEETT